MKNSNTTGPRPRASRPHAGRNNQQNNKGRSRNRGGQRRPSEYDQPETSGIAALAATPRSVVLALDEPEAEALLLVLRASGLVETVSYVEKKLAWTRQYNANLTRKH